MRTIAIYESLFSDPITIQILFRYSTGGPAPSPSPSPSPAPAPAPAPAPVPPLFRQAFSQQVFRPFTTYRGTISSAL